MVPFKSENIKAYELFLEIEIILREFIRDVMERKLGKGWRKQIPGELLKKIRFSELEENRPQFGFVKYGPLYYLTFGELIDIFEKKDLKQEFQIIGGELFVGKMKGLLSVRNALGHSRSVGKNGLLNLTTVHEELVVALTLDKIKKYMENLDVGVTPEESFKKIRDYFKVVLNDVCELKKTEARSMYESLHVQYWWGSNELAGFDCVFVDDVFKLVIEYEKIPTGPGSLSLRHNFVEKNKFSDLLNKSIELFGGATNGN